MVAGHGVLLLEGSLVFLVDDDKTETLERQEHCRTGTENDVVGTGRKLLLPYLHALGIAVLRMIDAKAVAKHAAQPLHHLNGKCNLGQEVEHLTVLIYFPLYEVDVYLGLAARSDAMKQGDGMLQERKENLVVGLLLRLAKLFDKLGMGLSDMVQTTHLDLVGL